MFSLDSSARKLFHGLHWRLVESKQGLLKFSGGEVGEFNHHCSTGNISSPKTNLATSAESLLRNQLKDDCIDPQNHSGLLIL